MGFGALSRGAAAAESSRADLLTACGFVHKARDQLELVGMVKLEPGAYSMVFATRGFFGYVVAPSGEVWWFANVRCERELGREELASTDWRARLLDVFRGDAGPMCALIQATPGLIEAVNSATRT